MHEHFLAWLVTEVTFRLLHDVTVSARLKAHYFSVIQFLKNNTLYVGEISHILLLSLRI